MEAAPVYDEAKLKQWSRLYWGREEEDTATRFYLGPLGTGSAWPPEPLLHMEMRHAEQRHAAGEHVLPHRPSGDTQPLTLALLVGDSFQPLLQTIWAYRPTRLVFVVNEYYGSRRGADMTSGRTQWLRLREQVLRLPPDKREACSGDLAESACPKPVSDDPQSVFEYLHAALRTELADPNQRVVIDITGAKKTMVAGAFLLAAYTNAEISYVDFDSYDPDKRRPYGYTCRFREVNNPFHHLLLSQWERAAQAFERHDFAGARAALPAPADLPGTRLAAWQTGLQQLGDFLDLCDDWENGYLHKAHELLQTLPALRNVAPQVVAAVGKGWPDMTPDAEPSLDFLTDPEKLITYAYDELARAERLAGTKSHRNTRAAFVRAYALHETLMKARFIFAFLDAGAFTVTTSGANWASNKLPDDERAQATDWILLVLNSGVEKRLMQLTDGDSADVRTWRKGIKLYKSAISLPDLAFLPIDKKLSDKRNLIVHSYVPTPNDAMGEVIGLAQANLDDYRTQWAPLIQPRHDPAWEPDPDPFQRLTWSKLKTLCGLDAFVPDPRPPSKGASA